jgi:hypothetical protein
MQRISDGFLNHRMRMAQYHWTPGINQVNEFIAVFVKEKGSFCPLHE